MPRSLAIASLKRRTPSTATRLPLRSRIHDHRVPCGDHADRVAGDGGERVRNWSDCADYAKRSMLDHRQAMIATEGLGTEKLCSWRTLAQGLEFLDLVFKATDLGLVHFHRAEFDAVVDRDATDVVDDLLAFGQATRSCSCSNAVRTALTASFHTVKIPWRP